MKFLIIGDLHGKKPHIYYKDFDAILAVGDFCSTKFRKYMFKVIENKLKNPNYKKDWYDLIGKKKAKKFLEESFQDGRKVLEFLNSLNTPIYIVPGNVDRIKNEGSSWDYLKKDYFKKLKKNLRNIKDCHNKIIDLKECQIIGYGISSGPEFPQYKQDLKKLTKKQIKEEKKEYKKLLKKYDKLYKKTKKPVIFLSHNVPFNTPIDKIVNKKSPRNGQHFGSLLTRELIDKYQPLICVGGHMHEHFKKCKIRKTTCINAGFGPYVNTFLEIKKGKIKKLELYYSKKGKYNPYK